MPPRRCLVQHCDRVADKELGISIHTSPGTSSEYATWKRFVSQHRKHFHPKGLFGICSLHFTSDSFTRSVNVKGSERRLKPGSVPTIWKKDSVSLSKRSRRRVSCIISWISCLLVGGVTFMVLLLNNKLSLLTRFDDN